MQIYEIILIGVALSIDACALTIANCGTYKNSLTKARAWLMPLFFGLFQGVMPLIGYFVGFIFAGFLGEFIKYLVSIVFFLLAVKIIVDILKNKNCEKDDNATCKISKLTLAILLIQALATSIDALIVGVTLLSTTISIFIAVSIIAVVTFLLVSISLFFGKKLGDLFGKYAEWIGVGILLFLAIKNLIETLIA